ncbi:MAG: inorganic phosphate transporter family protein [Actinomycetales bacterium]|nr:inorganic phosphate transporter family protein [Actinomycetales bacterium]
MDWTLIVVIVLILIALGFDFTNGFHDAANAIATSVGTKALSMRTALIMAAVLNFVGAFLGQEVAKTIQSVVDPGTGPDAFALVGAALVGAIVWNLITWRFGMPSSSSHALIGAVVGSALVVTSDVNWSTVWNKVIIPMVTSPFVGLILAFLVMRVIYYIWRNRNRQATDRGFRHAQVVSAAAMSLGHGLQDAQKTMGIIALVLIAAGYRDADAQAIPLWVVALCAGAISLGTAFGGQRIMRTLGRRVIDLSPERGFAAESVASSILYVTAYGIQAPVSTTQVITGSILGAGAEKSVKSVRWNVGVNILWAWILTLPMAAIVAAGVHVLLLALIGY